MIRFPPGWNLERLLIAVGAIGAALVAFSSFMRGPSTALPLKARTEIVARDRAFLEGATPVELQSVERRLPDELEPGRPGIAAVIGDKCSGKDCRVQSLWTQPAAVAAFESCNASTRGTLKFANDAAVDGGGTFAECNGSSWVAIGSASSGAGVLTATAPLVITGTDIACAAASALSGGCLTRTNGLLVVDAGFVSTRGVSSFFDISSQGSVTSLNGTISAFNNTNNGFFCQGTAVCDITVNASNANVTSTVPGTAVKPTVAYSANDLVFGVQSSVGANLCTVDQEGDLACLGGATFGAPADFGVGFVQPSATTPYIGNSVFRFAGPLNMTRAAALWTFGGGLTGTLTASTLPIAGGGFIDDGGICNVTADCATGICPDAGAYCSLPMTGQCYYVPGQEVRAVVGACTIIATGLPTPSNVGVNFFGTH